MKHVHLHSSERPSPDPDPGPPRFPSTFALRVRVHLHRRQLDRQLADGLAPEAFRDRALRATQLAGMPARREVARSLRRLVEHAERPAGAVIGSAVPVCRRSVLTWREGLLGLAERLEQPVPLDPRGVARALVLLTDGGGPFYDARAPRSMSDAVWWIADGLQH
jgi:hypothetical protein